ncbi:MAG TPA: PAS domain S-box protein, partial [Rhodoferax sp.]|nr:PAS domain S-box protein [Rhodoferax sp.]
MNSKVSLWRSLQARATVFTLAVFVLGIWALSLYASGLLQADLERVLGQQQLSTASVMAHEINDRLRDRLQALETIAKEVDADLMGQPGALQTRLEQRPLLQLLFNGGAWAAATDGVAIADVPGWAQRIGTSYRDVDFIAAALKDGKASISRPVIGKKRMMPIFAITVPIRTKQGQVIGVLTGVTDLGKPNFLDLIAQSDYGKTGGYLLIAAEHRMVISATDKSRIMEPLPTVGSNASIDRFANGYEGSAVLTNPRGVEVLVSGKGIPVAGWYVLVSLPTAEAFAPVRDLQQRLLWATLLLTLLTGALTWWVLKRQLVPLVATADALAALADAQQMAQPLSATRPDEIAYLVDGFNRILARWTQREAALTDSQQNLAITLNSIGDAVIATDAAGLITRMNPTAERLTAWPLADALGRPLTEVFSIVNASTREPVAAPVQRVIECGEVVGLANHTMLLAKDGREYQIADSAAPIRNAAGDIVGVVLVFSDVTEKYQVEQALLETEWKFRALFEKGPIGVAYHEMIYDDQGRPKDYFFIDANATYQELTGVNPLGKTVTQAFPGIENDPFDWIGTYGRVARTGEPVRFEQFLPSNGCWYDCAAYQFKPDGFVVAFLNITERKKAEQDARESHRRLSLALDAAAIGEWEIDLATQSWHRSLRHGAIFGQSEPLPLWNLATFFDHVHPDDLGRVKGSVQQAQALAQDWRDEFRIVRDDQAVRWVWATGHVLMNAQGLPEKAVGMVSDITERKQAEEALRIAATAFESQQGMVVTDAQRMILRVNQAAADITGYSADEAVGQNPRMLKSGRHDSGFYDAMTQALEQDGIWAGEIWNRRKNGEIYPEWLSISAVKDDAGLTSHFVGIFTDISERINAQAQIDTLAFY